MENSSERKKKVKRIHERDGIIKTLKSFGFSDIEIKSFLKVGSGRISRVMSNKPIEPPKAPKHAVKDKDTWRIVDFVLSLDLEPGYPCAHRSSFVYMWRGTIKVLVARASMNSTKTNVKLKMFAFFPTTDFENMFIIFSLL